MDEPLLIADLLGATLEYFPDALVRDVDGRIVRIVGISVTGSVSITIELAGKTGIHALPITDALAMLEQGFWRVP